MNQAHSELLNCHVCPQNCGSDRSRSAGFCGAGTSLRVNSVHLHHGEEPVLSGSGGSGTIFFAHCNLRCVYCQNHQISHLGWGTDTSETECALLMLKLQEAGAHNINLVSPTHYSPQLAASIRIARGEGLTLPVVWNSNAYEHPATLNKLAGLVDVYLPDFKYAHAAYGLKYSRAKDYPAIALDAITEMFSQVGELDLSASGLARRGVLVRHLVLPNRLSGTREALYQLSDNFGGRLSLSLMAQYYPTAAAHGYPELDRGLQPEEYQEALELAQELGFARIFAQELNPSPDWTPVFAKSQTIQDVSVLHFHGRNQHAQTNS